MEKFRDKIFNEEVFERYLRNSAGYSFIPETEKY